MSLQVPTIFKRLRHVIAKLSPFRWGLLIFGIGLLVRVALLFATHSYRDLERYELERTAISLATNGVYGNPYLRPTGPTAHVAPGYTLILAALFKLFGTGIPAEIIKRLLASAVSSILWGLLPFAALRIFGDIRPGVLAGLAAALLPLRPLVEIEGDWESPYTALALLFVALSTLRLWRRCELRVRTAIVDGVLWGISLLFVPALITLFVAMLLAGIYFCRQAGRMKYLRFGAIELFVVALCLTPWTVRNYYALGSPVVTRTNVGLELHISNNDDASADQRINMLNKLFERYHPLQSEAEALKVRAMGEVAYNREARAQAKQWMRTHPRRFIELCLGRMRTFWLYNDPASRMKTMLLALTNLLGWAGFIYLASQDRLAFAVSGLILLVFPLPNYLVHVGLRQEFPVHWLMMLLGAWLLVRLLSVQQAHRDITCVQRGLLVLN